MRLTPVPAELTRCADEPVPPALPERDGTAQVQSIRDQLVLAYTLALRSAWGDCRAKVDGARAWNEAASPQ